MSNESKWNEHYEEIVRFVTLHHRRPSKYEPEERNMHNWLKRQAKTFNKDEIAPSRREQYKQLKALLQQYRRVNQYCYAAANGKADKVPPPAEA